MFSGMWGWIAAAAAAIGAAFLFLGNSTAIPTDLLSGFGL